MLLDQTAFWILGTVFKGNANFLIEAIISWAMAHNVNLQGMNPQIVANLLHIIIEG